MYMVEITEDRLSGLSEHIEKALSHMGKVMQCVSKLESGLETGERTGVRGGYGNRYGRMPYGEYESYGGSGRYSRY